MQYLQYLFIPDTSYLWVLEPHLQPLHSHESSLFVAARGCEQTQQVSGHVVHRLPAVQLIPEDVKHIVLHTLCQFIIPRGWDKKKKMF